jgi:hypothetical protein
MDNLFNLTEISDLPKSVAVRLKSSLSRKRFEPWLELYRIAGRPLTLDEFIVGYYRTHKVVLDRREVINRLYWMAHCAKPMLVAVPRRRGVYALSQGNGN